MLCTPNRFTWQLLGWALLSALLALLGALLKRWDLDPVTLLTDIPTIRRRALEVLAAAEHRPGHIFNLGHGITPDVPPAHAKALVEIVHELGSM